MKFIKLHRIKEIL